MATAVVPFESAKVPAHLQKSVQANTDLTANVGVGFPVLSIKGKAFATIRSGERTLLTREDADGDIVPANSIELVLLRANKNLTKVYYDSGYKEGESDGKKPTCYSSNGDVPAADAEKPQSKTCAACKWNVWGSKISDNGSKVKACTDVRRIAVVAAGLLNDPMLLRVPPATLKPLSEYGQMLDKRGVSYNAVVTKVKFDPEMATPKLIFTPTRFLTEAEYAEVTEVAASDLVEQIIGAEHMPVEEGDAPATVVAEAAPEVDKPKPISAKKQAAIAAAEAAAKLAAEADAEEEEEAPAPAKPAKGKGKGKPATVVEDGDLDAELDSLLNDLDD